MLSRFASLGLLVLCGVLLTGCASTERALVQFGYDVQPSKGLPRGMDVIAIQPASVGETTDPKWSELSVAILKDLVNRSKARYGTPITLTDRRDTNVTFDNADAQAAGLVTGDDTSRGGGQLLGSQGTLLSTINVINDVKYGSETRVKDFGAIGGGGRGVGGGGFDLKTKEVTTVERTLTVQVEFTLLDTSNNREWDRYTAPTFMQRDESRPGALFGANQTEADLPPADPIIRAQVIRGAQQFISQLMPCRIDVDAYVDSSSNKDCINGVRLLRGQFYSEALDSFRAALSANSSDHRAAFGAGVACEAMGRFDDALRYYRRACMDSNSGRYTAARDRVETYRNRVKAG